MRLADLSEIALKVKTSLDMWVTFLTRHDLLKKDRLPVPLNTPALQKALDVLEEMNLKPEEREMYEDHLKYLRDIGSAIHKKESEAFEEGEQIGREKGRLEGKAEVVLNLLGKGFPIEEVSEWTGLSISEILELQNTKPY